MRRVILAGGTVIDGTGGPATAADVILEDGVIAEVGRPESGLTAGERHDVTGMCVAPGFIDAHSHADNAPFLPFGDDSTVRQGVTTEVVGNCGLSLAPHDREHHQALTDHLGKFFPPVDWSGGSFADLLRQADERGYVTNYAPLAGHGALRIAVGGNADRLLTEDELDREAALLSASLDAGAIGLSTGLVYAPGSFSDTAEIVRLASVVAERGGVYASHIRNESAGRMAAIEEAIDIGRRSGARVQISHHKAMGPAQWGSIGESLAAARAAREDGVDVRFDVYPYAASSTALVACLPRSLTGLADPELLEALASRRVAARLRELFEGSDPGNRISVCGGFDGILVAGTGDHRFEGRTLQQIADERGTDGTDAVIHVLREESLHAAMVCFAMAEPDIDAALRDDDTCIGSDGAPPGTDGYVHPRGYGTFPRILGHYVRERSVLTLEDAVRRMTSLPADTFGLRGIGQVARGFAADLVVFDPATVNDRATYTAPRQHPDGIRDVYVSGQRVVEGGRFTGARAGRRLRGATS